MLVKTLQKSIVPFGHELEAISKINNKGTVRGSFTKLRDRKNIFKSLRDRYSS